jgi:hypothetical protein
MSQSRTTTSGGNPGKAGPKGALELPAARNKKGGRQEDRNEQRNFVTLSKKQRKKAISTAPTSGFIKRRIRSTPCCNHPYESGDLQKVEPDPEHAGQ